MNRYRVEAILEAPVAVRRDRQSERSESVRSIGGTLVRGALARSYLQQRGQTDETFRRLFLDEGTCRFGPLDPTPRVFPLTAVTCKREGDRHTVVDQLWVRIAQHWLGGPLPGEAETPWRHCRRCGADLKTLMGFFHEDEGRVRAATHDRHSVAAHVGVDRATLTAAESIFYTLEALDPVPEQPPSDHPSTARHDSPPAVHAQPNRRPYSLVGWLEAESDLLAALQGLLTDDGGVVYLGHHRTRGYGRVRLHIAPESAPNPTAVQGEWDTWSAALIGFLKAPPFAVPAIEPRSDFFFSLSLPTGAILVDHVLRYSLDPASMVGWLPPLPQPDDGLTTPQRPAITLPTGGTVRCVGAVSRHERVRGWNAAHGLPRQDEWAVMRGAVYAYWFQGIPEERQALNHELWRVSQAGIGLRRNEGFGVVEVSGDFHCHHCNQETRP